MGSGGYLPWPLVQLFPGMSYTIFQNLPVDQGQGSSGNMLDTILSIGLPAFLCLISPCPTCASKDYLLNKLFHVLNSGSTVGTPKLQ